MIRVGATADVHFGTDSAGTLRPQLEHLSDVADVLLIAGDLTRHGSVDEAAVLADELRDLPVRVIAVLGNHDYELDQPLAICEVLEAAGIRTLFDATEMLDVGGCRLAVIGAKGFGGGFFGACGSDFGEPEMKAYIRHTKSIAAKIEHELANADADARVVMLHYAPVEDTLRGERLEIYPFLGSYLLAEAIDRCGADLVVHGHAHNGSEKGMTPGGIPVRNVAQPVTRQAYTVHHLDVPFVDVSARVSHAAERG